MFSSIFSFIVRYIILNPMALVGMCGGIYAMLTYDIAGLIAVVSSPYTYLTAFAIALLYALIFQHVYYPNSQKIDWWSTITSSIHHMTVLLVAAACGIALVYIINSDFDTKIDKYIRRKK